MSTTLIRNGTVVTAADRYPADVYIDKGVVTLIGQGLVALPLAGVRLEDLVRARREASTEPAS